MKIKDVSKLTGLSIRTLRYYDEIGLLTPAKSGKTSYRIYTNNDLDYIQQILFYKKLNYPLAEIKKILQNPSFNLIESLKIQKEKLEIQRNQLDKIIQLLNNTLMAKEGELEMTNEQKFEAFKEQLILENEKNFGEEVRTSFGEEALKTSNEKLKSMTSEQYEAAKGLEQQLFNRLKEGLVSNALDDDLLLEIAELHKRWLSFYWKKYTKQAHLGLSMMYEADDRFITYYDNHVLPGATDLLVKSIKQYTKE